jgi:phosphomannomutase
MRLFGTSGIRGDLSMVTPHFALRLGEALALFFTKRNIDTVSVGRDFRSSSPLLANALISSLNSCGINVRDLGLVPTPVLSYFSDNAGVMVTASHNPPENNGFKVFLRRKESFTIEEDEIEGYMSGSIKKDWQRVGARRSMSPIPDYIDAAVGYGSRLFSSFERRRVVLDCGNGVGSLVSPALLKKCNCEVIVLNGTLDPTFPGRGPEPSEEMIGGLRNAVVAKKADVGFALDGDGDRINVVDERGNVIPEDSIIALLGGFYRRREEDVVLTSLDTSFRIEEHCRNVRRLMLGKLQEGIDVYGAVFAGEPWKYIHPRWAPFIDGLVTSVVILGLMKGKKASELCARINEYPRRKYSLREKEGAIEVFRHTIASRRDIKSTDTISGIRANFNDDSWILLRPSGTEKKVRVIIEGKNEKRLAELENLLLTCL